MRTLAAYGVHVFTASGIIFGFLALIAVVEEQRFTAFLMLGIALFIDGIDGTFARWVGVKERTPHIDGVTLDNVIDYVTYVAIPALMVWHWSLVPDGWGVIVGAGMMLASCYTYANANIKTEDSYFVGFPAIWNCVVLYLLILGARPIMSLTVLATCFILSFIPSTYIHPLRVKLLRPVSIVATVLWTLAVCALTWFVLAKGQAASAQPIWLALLVITTLYFGAISLYRSVATS